TQERETGRSAVPPGRTAQAADPGPGPERVAAAGLSLRSRHAGRDAAATLVAGGPLGGEALQPGAELLDGLRLGPGGGRLVSGGQGGREGSCVGLALPRDPEPTADPDRAACERRDLAGFLVHDGRHASPRRINARSIIGFSRRMTTRVGNLMGRCHGSTWT